MESVWDGQARARCLNAIAEEMDLQNADTISFIQREFLSFPKDRPTTTEGLRVISNSLRRALFATPAVVNNEEVSSVIGNNVRAKGGVNYALVHEFGGMTPPREIRPREKKVLKFMVGGRTVFAKKVKHPGAIIPERAPVRRGIAACLPKYTRRIESAIHRTLEPR